MRTPRPRPGLPGARPCTLVTCANAGRRPGAAGPAVGPAAGRAVVKATVRGPAARSAAGWGRSGPAAERPRARNSLGPMLVALTVALSAAALALAAWCGFAAYRDQPTKDWHFIGMGVVTVLALAQVVVGVVMLARGEEAEEGTAIFVSYLVGAFLAVPAAGFMSLVERSRWGSAVVAAGGVVLAVLEVRLHDIWTVG